MPGTCPQEHGTCHLLGTEAKPLTLKVSPGPALYLLEFAGEMRHFHSFSTSSLEDQRVPNYSLLAAPVPRWEAVRNERPHVVLLGLATEHGVEMPASRRR